MIEEYQRRVLCVALCAIWPICLLCGGCDTPSDNTPPPPPPPPLPPRAAATQPSTAESTPSPFPTLASGLRQKQIEFLKKLRSEKEFAVVAEARTDARGQVALVLQRELSSAESKKMLESALARLMQEFPGEDLALSVYGPPPRSAKLGRAMLNAATLQITHQSSSASR